MAASYFSSHDSSWGKKKYPTNILRQRSGGFNGNQSLQPIILKSEGDSVPQLAAIFAGILLRRMQQEIAGIARKVHDFAHQGAEFVDIETYADHRHIFDRLRLRRKAAVDDPERVSGHAWTCRR